MAMRMGAGAPGLSGLLKEGHKHMSGLEEVIVKNIEACKQLSQITRTSLGPNGMNKLVINHLGKLFITSDSATLLKELEVEHPAAKMLVMAAEMQEQEMGDASNLVVTFAGELLSNAESLLRLGVHPSEVLLGYSKAAAKTAELLESLTCHTVSDVRSEAQLADVLRTVVSSKHFGYEELISSLVARACISIMPPAPKRPSINVDSVRVCKLIGGSIMDSTVIKGIVVQRQSEGAVTHAEDAKIAVFGCGIEAGSTESKGTVVIRTAEELKAFNKEEERLMEESIKSIADAGAKVVVAGGSISEIAQHFLNKYNLLFVKIVSKFELRRLCRSVGATALVRVGPPTPDEMGHADRVYVQELGSRKVTIFQQLEDESQVATVVLRGSTMNMLDDVERAIDDAVNTAKVLCKDGRCVAGAGATEIELAHQIQQMAESTPGLEQYAIAKFAEAFEVIPRTLAENSGQNASDVLSSLYAAHASGSAFTGVDIEGGGTTDAKAARIYDALATKASALNLAADAALTVLRVDQIIMSKQAGGPKPRDPQAPDAD